LEIHPPTRIAKKRQRHGDVHTIGNERDRYRAKRIEAREAGGAARLIGLCYRGLARAGRHVNAVIRSEVADGIAEFSMWTD
jgi:hypothetical protein